MSPLFKKKLFRCEKKSTSGHIRPSINLLRSLSKTGRTHLPFNFINNSASFPFISQRKMSFLNFCQFRAENEKKICRTIVRKASNLLKITDCLLIYTCYWICYRSSYIACRWAVFSSFRMFAKGCAKWLLVYLDLPGRSKGWSTMALWVGLRKQPKL
jgi:hypothetical protein